MISTHLSSLQIIIIKSELKLSSALPRFMRFFALAKDAIIRGFAELASIPSKHYCLVAQ